MGHEHEPGVTAWIIGDGKYFFRTLSYFLTGAQREHQRLRALMCQFMRENNEQFNAIANQKDYIITCKVSQLGEYATEVEIFAAATFLGIPIWTFSPYVITSKVSQLGEYATEVEIFAAATFLGIPIWTFSPYGDSYRWQCHRPVSGLPSPFSLTEKDMYIKTCMNILSLCLVVKQV